MQVGECGVQQERERLTPRKRQVLHLVSLQSEVGRVFRTGGNDMIKGPVKID